MFSVSIQRRFTLAVLACMLLPLVHRGQEPNPQKSQSARDDEPPRRGQSIRDKDKPADPGDRPQQSIRDKRPQTEIQNDFAQSARDVRQGIFLVGGPNIGIGTAWVISKEHRLLVTNAHVADMYIKAPRGTFRAMMNGSDVTYDVERVWFHPGVRRHPTKDENIAVRSGDVRLGPVYPQCPDVAVMQLSMGGPPLPVELKIAPAKTLFDLQALPAAILGFPGHDTTAWPAFGKKSQATFHTGVISRVTDYQLEGGGRDEYAQMLQYTMESWGGYSGSPVFLGNGQVVGLHNMVRRIAAKGGNPERSIAHGVRADAVWELLVHHKLTNKVAVGLPTERIFVQRWLEHDPEWDRYLKLSKLVEEASYLIHTRLEYAAGIAKAQEAINLYPRYAPAYIERSLGYNNWFFAQGDNWTLEKKVDYLLRAFDDAEIYRKLHPRDDLDMILSNVTILNNLGYVSGDQKYNRQAMRDALLVLNAKQSTNWQRARAMSSKAVALSNLGQSKEARGAHNEAISMNADSAILWDNRAIFLENNDSGEAARYDRAMARNLRKKEMLLRNSARKDHKVVSEVRQTLTDKEVADNRGRYMKSWSVEMEAGYFYQIDLKSPDFGISSKYDPILRLYDEKTTFLQEDDDGGGYPNARIFFTPARTQSFILTLTSYEPRQTGPYVLTVTKIAKDQ